ncbi:hypothetical protein BX666DRAFT_1852096, partial [Dichotomocladium elegans]
RLQEILDIVGEIKQQNLKFDLNTYNSLLTAYAQARDISGLLKTFEEMQQSTDIKANLDSYNTVMEGLALSGQISRQAEVMDALKESNLSPSVATYTHWLRGVCNAQQLEHALDLLDEMKEAGLTPNSACFSIVISACLQLGDPETAFTLLKDAEQAGMAAAGHPRIYMDVMRATASGDKYEMAAYCWDKAVNSLGMRPDEGTCLSVLGVAAKHGDPKLATMVIRLLSTNGYPYKEHYFAPLVESFVAKKDLKSAFNVLDIMRVSGVAPTARTTMPIRESLGKNVQAIDDAYFILEELKKEGRTVDVTAFNAVVEMCAELGDLQRTVATYREAKNLGVTPDVDTYNCVLEACVQAKTKGMGNVVISEMKKAGIMPNIETYVKMIALECTQANYEGAFSYLEEMKGYGVIPPQSTYETLAHRLARAKDPRFHLALEEMETFGYPIRPNLSAAWK